MCYSNNRKDNSCCQSELSGKAKFAGVGLVVKLNYKLSKKVKTEIKNYYKSMGPNWARQNTNERIPNVPI